MTTLTKVTFICNHKNGNGSECGKRFELEGENVTRHIAMVESMKEGWRWVRSAVQICGDHKVEKPAKAEAKTAKVAKAGKAGKAAKATGKAGTKPAAKNAKVNKNAKAVKAVTKAAVKPAAQPAAAFGQSIGKPAKSAKK